MRKYTLASHVARDAVDLQCYREAIEAAVHEVMPEAEVTVCQGYYTVTPSPERGDAIRIGKKVSKTVLGQYCIQIPKLFCGEEV